MRSRPWGAEIPPRYGRQRRAHKQARPHKRHDALIPRDGIFGSTHGLGHQRGADRAGGDVADTLLEGEEAVDGMRVGLAEQRTDARPQDNEATSKAAVEERKDRERHERFGKPPQEENGQPRQPRRQDHQGVNARLVGGAAVGGLADDLGGVGEGEQQGAAGGGVAERGGVGGQVDEGQVEGEGLEEVREGEEIELERTIVGVLTGWGVGWRSKRILSTPAQEEDGWAGKEEDCYAEGPQRGSIAVLAQQRLDDEGEHDAREASGAEEDAICQAPTAHKPFVQHGQDRIVQDQKAQAVQYPLGGGQAAEAVTE